MDGDVLARYEPLVDDPAAFRAACGRPLPMVVRVNTIKACPARVRTALDEADVGWTGRDWTDTLLEVDTDRPGNTWPYFCGWVHGQEEVSTIPAGVLDPAPGDRVWDSCAAPGGKACQLAALMDDAGLVVANDRSLGRIPALRANAERLGVTGIAVTNVDARNFSLKPFGFDRFDAALVDAPCSGEGTVRKNPAALDDWSEAFLAEIARVQRDILTRAVRVTRAGGTVIYSTCTFAPEENEAVLDAVIDRTGCRIVPFHVPLDSSPGVTAWGGAEYDAQVRHARRFYPHQNDTGGFFCAALEVAG